MITRTISLVALCCGFLLQLHAASLAPFTLSWTNNLLSVRSAKLPGGKLDIWYLEAFCTPGAHDQSWDKTKVPHRTRLLPASQSGDLLEFETEVQDGLQVRHSVRSEKDGLRFDYDFKNASSNRSRIQWFQPACIRVADFTGRNQTNFIDRSFMFTDRGLTLLSQTGRTEDALYRGGQVYVPSFIARRDANPRPLANAAPVNGLIGCFSADNKLLLATASDQTHELFEGVYVCLHSDPWLGELKPGEERHVSAKLYILPNNPKLLLKRYKKDFPHTREQRLPF